MATWYRTGTTVWTNSSPNVVGSGTLWMTQATVGDVIWGPDGEAYEITSITDDTHLAVKQRTSGTAAYAGSTASAQPYAILRNFTSTLPAELASKLSDLLIDYHQTLDEWADWLSGTGTMTVHNSAGIAYTVPTASAVSASVNGYLSKSVAGGSNVALTSTEAANAIINLTGTLTANINVTIPDTTKGIKQIITPRRERSRSRSRPSAGQACW